MPEEEIVNQETISAEPSAGGSAEEELLPTSEASKLAGTSARTLKRRADLGRLRRTSVHTQFGIESRYYKKEIEKLRQELHQKSAEVVAEVSAELKGRHADGAEVPVAGGDRKVRSGAELADVTKVIDQKIDKITAPFLKLANTLEGGFDKLLDFQERLMEIETNRDRERREDREEARKRAKEEREEAKRRAKEERLKTRVIIGSYVFAIFGVLGLYWFLFWLLRSGMLFGRLW